MKLEITDKVRQDAAVDSKDKADPLLNCRPLIGVFFHNSLISLAFVVTKILYGIS